MMGWLLTGLTAEPVRPLYVFWSERTPALRVMGAVMLLIPGRARLPAPAFVSPAALMVALMVAVAVL